MNSIKIINAGADPGIQSRSVLLLCRCFDEWVDFRNRWGERFPFLEYSFVAEISGEIIGHVGIMPFDIDDGAGGVLRMAGVASVGVAPEHRCRGIAGMICEAAAKWAAAEKYDAMPLYTGVPRVYEKCGWEVIGSGGEALVPPGTAASQNDQWKRGAELTAREKSLIQSLYAALPPLPGRVIRPAAGGYFCSWEWLFQNDLARWLVYENGYALSIDGVLAELGGAPPNCSDISNAVSAAFLSPRDPGLLHLVQHDWHRVQHVGEAPECWHGEIAMLRKLSGKAMPEELFFPLADKF